jgi:hypothetical protein
VDVEPGEEVELGDRLEVGGVGLVEVRDVVDLDAAGRVVTTTAAEL